MQRDQIFKVEKSNSEIFKQPPILISRSKFLSHSASQSMSDSSVSDLLVIKGQEIPD